MNNQQQIPRWLREFDGGIFHTILSLGAVVLFVSVLCAFIGASA
jgi:hypothetical protein